MNGIQEVGGSIPPGSTISFPFKRPAQARMFGLTVFSILLRAPDRGVSGRIAADASGQALGSARILKLIRWGEAVVVTDEPEQVAPP